MWSWRSALYKLLRDLIWSPVGRQTLPIPCPNVAGEMKTVSQKNKTSIYGTFILYRYFPRTTIVSLCFPSKGKNSLMQTSKPPEFTFSNHT